MGMIRLSEGLEADHKRPIAFRKPMLVSRICRFQLLHLYLTQPKLAFSTRITCPFLMGINRVSARAAQLMIAQRWVIQAKTHARADVLIARDSSLM